MVFRKAGACLVVAAIVAAPGAAVRGQPPNGDVPGARQIEQLTKEIAGHPTDALLLVRRAELHRAAGRWGEMKSDLDRALAGEEKGPPELLDTRGFILHLLGRHQEAIDLLNLAIDESQRQRRQVAMLSGRADAAEIAYRLRSLDHGLAVMHQHRGLACRAAGLERQAAQDLEIAKRKGYAPERGIF